MHKRIEEIVKLFPKVKTVADIGCDHAYSSILLIRSGKAEHVYACDIGEKALESARRNILKEGLEEKISCHLGDGLSAFSRQDCEALLLSGMGGPLMLRILEGRLPEFSYIVLSPQSDFRRVREELSSFRSLIEERYVEEAGKFYRLMLSGKGKEQGEHREVEWEYGWIPLQKRDPVLKRMLEKEKQQFQPLYREKKSQAVEKKVSLIQEALSYYER